MLHALIFAQVIRKIRKPQIALAAVARAKESLLETNMVDIASEHGTKATERPNISPTVAGLAKVLAGRACGEIQITRCD